MLFDLRTEAEGLNQQRIQAVLDAAREQPGSTVVLPPGTYILTSPLAKRTMEAAIYGEYGENPEGAMFRPDFPFSVGLSFSGHEGTTLEAYGVTLLVDGFMEPISLDHCRNVTLMGLTIDHLRKPYSRGVIELYEISEPATSSGSITVRFDDAFPVNERTIMPRYCAYDFHTHRFQLDMQMTDRKFLGDQRFRMEMAHMPAEDLAGQEFYIWHSFHFRPTVLLEEASGLTLRDVTIHSQPGMGVVGHHCDDILLERVQVVPSHGEHMSTNTDATHFVSCKGNLIFRDCAFEGHGDDATNVHTFYHDIRFLDNGEIQGSVSVPTHSLKPDYPDLGDEMQLVDRKSLLPRGIYRVLRVERGENHYRAMLDAPLPLDAPQQCYLANLTRSPAVIFEGCTTENHWARAVLLKCRSALIQNCQFRGSVLQAIHVAAEEWWREGISCENITIRNNRFVDCGITGHSPVGGVKVEMEVDAPAGTPQKHIRIEDNCFDLPGVARAVLLSNAEDVVLHGNVYLRCAEPVEIRDCLSVQNDDGACR